MKYQHKLNENERLVLLQAKNIIERLEQELAESLLQLDFDRVEQDQMESESNYISETKQMLGALSARETSEDVVATPKVDPELVWLRWFYKNVSHQLGPADVEIYRMLIDEFDKKHDTVKVPKSYRDEDEE